MTYDNWKTTNPADAEMGEPQADCDCCGKHRPVTRTWAYGLETWACDECLYAQDMLNDATNSSDLRYRMWRVNREGEKS